MRTAISRLAGWGIALLCATPPGVVACQVCIPFPTKSAADYLIEADTVVLAREDPERPFHYAPIEVLRGEVTGEPIDLFLDSTTRRLLRFNTERSVVQAYTADGEEKGWRRIGIADEAFAPLVRQVLGSAADWKAAPKLRVAFFGRLLDHENPQVRTLAHLEVARAPYAQIKSLKGALSRAQLHAFLANFRYIEWHPLYILLLAQDATPEDRERISNAFDSAAKFNLTANLGAWATALIEIDGEKGLARIEEKFLSGGGRPAKTVREVLRALSVHGGGGRIDLRDRIVGCYGSILTKHPSLTPAVAEDLIAWKRGELADEIAAYLSANREKLDFKQALRLRAYLRGAAGAESRGGLRPPQ